MMKLSIIKCLSIFVVSDNSEKCNQMRSALHSNMISPDFITGLSKVHLHKNCKYDPSLKDHHQRISREVAKLVIPFMKGIPMHFYGPDKNVNIMEQN